MAYVRSQFFLLRVGLAGGEIAPRPTTGLQKVSQHWSQAFSVRSKKSFIYFFVFFALSETVLGYSKAKSAKTVCAQIRRIDLRIQDQYFTAKNTA